MQIEDQDPEVIDLEQMWYDSYKTGTYAELAARMKELQAQAGEAERCKIQLNKELDVIRLKVVPERFAADNITSMNISGVGRLGLTKDMYCTQKKEFQENLFQWLRDNEYGDLIKDTVNPSSLKSLVKELLEDAAAKVADTDMFAEPEKTQADEIQEFLNVTPFMRASVTKK